MSGATTYPSFSYDIFAFRSRSSRKDFNDLFGEDTCRRAQLASEQARRDTIDALLKLEPRYQERNWDGQGADPIPAAALNEAHTFLLKLPATFPLPEVIPEPDGYLGLEWYANKRLLYVVSFNGKGALSCSGLFGQSKTYGTWYMDEGIPGQILSDIAKITS
jgi:hypothetical protein